MLPNLPYTALRALEATVRLRGFGRAALELGISQSAVSQHVRALEEWTGRRLLTRGSRQSLPTEDGQRLADAVVEGVGRIGEVCDQLRRPGKKDLTIVVSCYPGFAVNWLFPRLMRFDRDYPEYSVSISTNAALADFSSGAEDIAIRYGIGGYVGLHVEHLMGERIFPVCSPSLLTSGPALRSVADLSNHVLLYDQFENAGGDPPTWTYWARQLDLTLPTPAATRRFGQSNMVVQAAKQGFGVALGREPLVFDALQEGSLVRPFAGTVMSQLSYWFVCPRQHLQSRRVRDFRDWLHSEVAAQPDIM